MSSRPTCRRGCSEAMEQLGGMLVAAARTKGQVARTRRATRAIRRGAALRRVTAAVAACRSSSRSTSGCRSRRSTTSGPSSRTGPTSCSGWRTLTKADDTTVSLQAKAWGIRKRFEAEITEQRPDERIEWNVTQGFAHTGVVTFHELADRLTRIELTMDVEPSNVVDKASRGMRSAARAVRGDLHRFKAYIELNEEDEGGWRGTIEDGEVKSTHRAQL